MSSSMAEDTITLLYHPVNSRGFHLPALFGAIMMSILTFGFGVTYVFGYLFGYASNYQVDMFFKLLLLTGIGWYVLFVMQARGKERFLGNLRPSYFLS